MATLFAGRGFGQPRETYEMSDEVIGLDGHRYEIAERIAAGGNGVVHRCVDKGDGLEYAVKFQLDLRQQRRRRFERERSLLSELHHDHLIIYQDEGQAGGS